jgi:hypothetical protein
MTCPLIDGNLEAIRALARDFGVLRLEVFGSVGTPNFDPARSDVDFLAEYPEGYDFGPWMGRRPALRRGLEAILGRPVDLVTTRALRDPLFRAEADVTRGILYDVETVASSLDPGAHVGVIYTMLPFIEMLLPQIAALCRRYGVAKLDLFGSAAVGGFDEATSDFDFVATFSRAGEPGYADRYLSFCEALEALLGRSVDVVTERSIRSPEFRHEVDAARRKVYDERDDAAAA